MDAFNQLEAHLRGFRSAPFLFVGSGVSRRYLGLEDWTGLLRRFADLTPQSYAYYFGNASGHLPAVASGIADSFWDVWWRSEDYQTSRDEYAESVTTRESPLKVEIARYISSAVAKLPEEGARAEELSWLRKATIDGAITTNYDPLLEVLFPEFQRYVGQDELLFADAQGVGEIYKIHGSVERPDSIILTARDFDRFKSRNPYLAAKLLTVFIEHPVIFIGYSLSDKNVTDILVSVSRILTNENLAKLQDRLIFVTWDPDADAPDLVRSAIAVEGFTIPVMTIAVSDFVQLFKTLAALPRRFSAKLLRQLKHHIYELVLTNDPQGRLFVQDIDAETDVDCVDVVLGVGVGRKLSEQGYVGLSRRDLLWTSCNPLPASTRSGLLRSRSPRSCASRATPRSTDICGRPVHSILKESSSQTRTLKNTFAPAWPEAWRLSF